MELYKIKQWGNRPETYVEKNAWTNTIKNGKLEYFVSGQGYRKTKTFEIVNADIEAKKDALYIGKIAKEYGHNIAIPLCEEAFGCCRVSAENWVVMFQYAYEKAVENNIDPSQVAVEVANNFRGFFGMLDVTFLESKLAGLDNEFEPSRCRYKGKENVSTKEYVAEKYGELTALLIEKMLE